MQIYVAEGTQHTGPFDLETIKAGLRAGRYQPGQLAWYDGAPGWEPISRLPGMESFLPPPPPAVPQPPATPTISLQYQAPPPAPAYYPPAAYAPKRRPWWLIVGGVVVGLFALADGIYTMSRGLRSDHASDSSPAPTVAGSAPAAPSSTAPAHSNQPPVAPAVPAAGTRHFVANRARYSGNLATHFVAFAFDYPEDWTILENVSEEFVEVQRQVRLPNGSNTVVESISFSYAYGGPGVALASRLPAAGGNLLNMAAAALLSHFPQATRTPSRSGHYGRYPAQEQFLTSPADEDEERPGMYFRQAIVARPNNNGPDGMFITILGSDPGGNPDAESLGKSGGLKTIEDSFRFDP